MNKIDSANYFVASEATFKYCQTPTESPDLLSPNGKSMYWYDRTYLYRCSDHWGNGVGACKWKLTELPRPFDMVKHPTYNTHTVMQADKPYMVCGRVRWKDMDWVKRLPPHKTVADLMNQFVLEQGRKYLYLDIIQLKS